MKIVFFTSIFEFGEQSLLSLIKQGETIMAVVIPPDETDKSSGVKKLAEENGIPLHQLRSVKKPEIVELIKSWQPDLGVSAGNTRWVFTRAVLDCFSRGIINYHCSKLPKNGGQFPIHWQIYKGEPEIGITIHYCDEGIDTGDIMLQESVPLGPDDTFKSIYFGTVLGRSVDLLSRGVRLMRENTAPRLTQDLSEATYNTPFGVREATLNWNDPAGQVYNAIRASDAWPGARTACNGATLKIWQAKKLDRPADGTAPGTVVAVTDQGAEIRGIGANILVERLQLEEGPKLTAADFYRLDILKTGDRLGGVVFLPQTTEVQLMKEYRNVIFESHEGVGVITLNRPKALNALNADFMRELASLADEIAADSRIRAVILTGSGEKAFVAGADIAEMRDLSAIEARGWVTAAQGLMDKIENLPQPVIAAVNGYALGGGCELAMACDIRIASEKAKFGHPEVTLGVMPGFGGTQRLPRLVGKGRAKEIIFTGEMVDAREAYRIGLVNKVVPAESLMDETRLMVAKILSRAPLAVGLAKSAVNRGLDVDLGTGVAYESEVYSLCYSTEDQKEGMTAFLQKREAGFHGR